MKKKNSIGTRGKKRKKITMIFFTYRLKHDGYENSERQGMDRKKKVPMLLSIICYIKD